ncbi:hypothetical protein NDN01_23990 [Sphingomonas sp. QA11]|uniref:hypothetical protein n=1 Tax=Sphingomonas sp. QA11 TaxID=2950605 RepID=UPI00234922B7|nr:hypothetical protein [Sphingomonas sp. QA11]WCM27008.1 hypothetical protein NDN01_23990 [Sphingomonas sp. QA11]
MSLKHVAALAALLLLNGNVAAAAEKGGVLDWGCNDVVAIGRVKTLAYTDMTGNDDVLGHGRFDTQVSVKRLVRGHEARRTLPASRIAHGQIRSDRDFILVLTRSSVNASYTIRTAALWKATPRPVLAAACSPTP